MDVQGPEIKNADLWEELCTISSTRLPGTVQVKKVKGHTTEEDVHKGVVKAEDKEENDAADALAVAGAFENDRKTVSKSLRVQLDATLAVQRMMISILQLRACKRAEQALRRKQNATTAASTVAALAAPAAPAAAKPGGGRADELRQRLRSNPRLARVDDLEWIAALTRRTYIYIYIYIYYYFLLKQEVV